MAWTCSAGKDQWRGRGWRSAAGKGRAVPAERPAEEEGLQRRRQALLPLRLGTASAVAGPLWQKGQLSGPQAGAPGPGVHAPRG